MTSLKTSIKIITYLSDIGCLEIQGASLSTTMLQTLMASDNSVLNVDDTRYNSVASHNDFP